MAFIKAAAAVPAITARPPQASARAQRAFRSIRQPISSRYNSQQSVERLTSWKVGSQEAGSTRLQKSHK